MLAITGASGAPYAVRLLRVLCGSGRTVHLAISPSGAHVLREETGIAPAQSASRFDPGVFGDLGPGRVVFHHHADFTAGIASGSFPTGGMVVCPCSMSTLASIAHGVTTNLITRAADVHLKERRQLILVPRETPLEPDPPGEHGRRHPGRGGRPAGDAGLVSSAEVARRPGRLRGRRGSATSSGVDNDLIRRWGYGREPIDAPDRRTTERTMTTDAPPAGPLGKLADILGMIRFSHTLFALPFALLGAALAAYDPADRLARGAEGLAGDPALHGDGAVGGDGLQPAGRPPARRAEPPDRDPAPAERPALGRGRWRPSRSRTRRCSSPRRACSCRRTPGRSSCRCRSCSGCSGTRMRSGSRAWRTTGSALALAMAPDRGLDRDPGRPRLAAGLARAGGAVLGRRVRHDLRLPGRRVRPSSRPAEPAGAARGPRCPAAGGGEPRGDGRGAGRPRARATRRSAGSTGRAWRRWRPAAGHEHALVRPDDLARVNVAFFHVNIGISLGLLGIGVVDLLV